MPEPTHGNWRATWHVAFLLARRQIQFSSIWLNLLIMAIMVLTFLNLVVITGILTGLIQGSLADNKSYYTGEVFISTMPGDSILESTFPIMATLQAHPDVAAVSARYVQSATVEANYQDRWDFTEPENSVGIRLTGIDPVAEQAVTGLADLLVEGEYLNENESGYVLMGAFNLAQYTDFSDAFDPLENVRPGSRVKLTFAGTGATTNRGPENGGSNTLVDRGGTTAEFIVKGIVDSKVGEVSSRVFLTQDDWNRLVNPRLDQATEIAMVLNTPQAAIPLVAELKSYGFDEKAQVETAEEAIPSFLNDLVNTFGLLGSFIGGVAVVVSGITVFVVIYINALTRRKQIGILKGIGVEGGAIERAYVMQSLFYAVIGSSIGAVLVFGLLVPYFAANPIDFPFSDGILFVTGEGTVWRAGILTVVTAVAGFVPSWLIVRQNTLDSILGR